MQSHFAFGGPEQVSPEEIAYEQYVAAQRHRHAGRSQASNVILTDEVRWPSGPPPKAHGGKATQSVMHSMLTDQLPVGVGAAPPRGYFFNANGQLQQLPSHAATAARSNMSNALFGGQLEANEVSRPAPGKAQVPGRAQRTIVDALIFGHQHGDQAQAEEVIADAAGGRHGKRVIAARPSVIGEAMRWEEERLVPSAYQPRQQDDGGEHGMAMYGGSGERQPEEYNPHFPVPTYHPQKGQQQQQYQPPSQYQQQQQYQPPSQYQPQQQYQPPSQYQPQQQHYQPPTQPPPRAPQQLGSYLQQQQQQPPYSQPPSVDRSAPVLPRPHERQPPPMAPASSGSYAAARAHAGAVAPGQLLYDQEKRQWVTRDGQPARFDPLLRGGAAVRQQPSALSPRQPQPSFVQNVSKASNPSGGGGLRHPRLWMTSAQKAHGDAPMDVLPPTHAGGGPNARRGQFSRAFAPPTGGGGFN